MNSRKIKNNKFWYLDAEFLQGVMLFFIVQPLLILVPIVVFFTEIFKRI